MNYFPHNPFKRSIAPTMPSLGSVRQSLSDVLWGRPRFKAPALLIPQVPLEPMPFTATRITQRAGHS